MSIKGLQNIKHLLTPAQITLLCEEANVHQRYSNLTFDVQTYNDEEKILLVCVRQGEAQSGNYADRKLLRERTEKLFQHYLPDYTINVVAATYEESKDWGDDL